MSALCNALRGTYIVEKFYNNLHNSYNTRDFNPDRSLIEVSGLWNFNSTVHRGFVVQKWERILQYPGSSIKVETSNINIHTDEI